MGDHMFTDLALSRDLTAEYKERKGGDQKLSLMILQRSVWPFSARKEDIALPVWVSCVSSSTRSFLMRFISLQMTDELNKFTEYYKEKYKGRKLEWEHSLGTATLRANFKAGAKELTVSMYQAIILLLFNDATEIPFRDIKEQTSMGESSSLC